MTDPFEAVAALKPYPAYKDSGVPWLRQVPEHWGVRRAKSIFQCIDLRSESGKEELLTVSSERGVILRSAANVTMFKAESYIGYKLCWPGDLVINSLWAWAKGLGVTRHHGIVSSAYGVYRLRPGYERCAGYIHELVRSNPFQWELQVRSKGIWISRLQLTDDAFLTAPILIPPDEDRGSIVHYLTYMDRQIHKYIRAKQKLIKLLDLRRVAMTERAMLASQGREVRIREVSQRIERPINRKEDEVYTPLGLYNRGRGIFHKKPTKGSDLGDSTFFWVAEGDLVLSGQFAWEGAVAIANTNDEGCVVSHRYPILRGREGLLESIFLLTFFQTGWGQLLLDHHSRGAAGRNRPLNIMSLIKEKIQVPPLSLQQPIIELFRIEIQERNAISCLTKTLHEYRTHLIADVITGKVDVRGISSRLPDIPEEPEQNEEIGENNQTGETPDEEEADVQPEEAEA